MAGASPRPVTATPNGARAARRCGGLRPQPPPLEPRSQAMCARGPVLATAVAAALLAPAPRWPHVDRSAGGADPIRAWAGIAVLSVLDPTTGTYQLATQTGTHAPQPLAGIAPAAQPFDADIGPGPGGAATIVFARCQAPGRCHLARTSPAGATADTDHRLGCDQRVGERPDRLGQPHRLRAPLRHRLGARLHPPAQRRHAGEVRAAARRARPRVRRDHPLSRHRRRHAARARAARLDAGRERALRPRIGRHLRRGPDPPRRRRAPHQPPRGTDDLRAQRLDAARHVAERHAPALRARLPG